MSLIVSKIRKEYPGRTESIPILRDCSFELESGQSLSVAGPSGSGKSTLLSILGTLEPASGGEAFLDSTDILNLPESKKPEFRRHRIGFVFQDHHLLPQCSALENVLMPFLAEGRVTGEHRERAVALLERVGLADRADHRPSELSGGERQRVAIARSLVYRPALLLADEPTGNLDRESASQIGDLLLASIDSTMLLLVTHDPSLAARTTKQYRLDFGTLQSNPPTSKTPG